MKLTAELLGKFLYEELEREGWSDVDSDQFDLGALSSLSSEEEKMCSLRPILEKVVARIEKKEAE